MAVKFVFADIEELKRMVATYERTVDYLKGQIAARCAAISAGRATQPLAAMADDSAPINKRQELDDKIVKWFDEQGDERRAAMLCARRYIDLAEPRVHRDSVEYEIRKELARLEKK